MTTPRGAQGRDALTVITNATPEGAEAAVASAEGVEAPPADQRIEGGHDATPMRRRLTAGQRGPQGMRRNGAGQGGGGRAIAVGPKYGRRPEIDLDELWAPVKPERLPPDREFLPGALEILEAPASPVRVALIYVLCALVSAALVWSWFGHLDVYADATGKVQASGRTKVVQPIVTGKVIGIDAVEGQKVKAGTVLVRLDPTAAIAERNVVRDNLFNARAEVIRHAAEIAAGTQTKIDVKPAVTWPADLPKAITTREEEALRSELSSLAATLANLEAQKSAKVAERDKYKNSIEPQKAVIALIDEHLGMRNELFKDGWNSRATVLEQEQQKQAAQLQLTNLQGSLAEAEAAIPVIQSQIDVARQSFVTTNTTAQVQAQQQVDKLTQDLAKAEDNVTHMTLRAPIDGTVQASAVTTVGQVVTAGAQIMQIVPEGTPLEVVAYVLNSDAGFVKVGQDATVKVDTFPYTRYGTIDGTVTQVAVDALPGKEAQKQQQNSSTAPSADGAMSITSAAQQTQDLVFPVTIALKQKGITVNGTLRPLSSGMTVTVEIKTESRRAIDYILSPLASMFEESAQER